MNATLLITYVSGGRMNPWNEQTMIRQGGTAGLFKHSLIPTTFIVRPFIMVPLTPVQVLSLAEVTTTVPCYSINDFMRPSFMHLQDLRDLIRVPPFPSKYAFNIYAVVSHHKTLLTTLCFVTQPQSIS